MFTKDIKNFSRSLVDISGLLGFQLLANDEDASAGITAVHVNSGLDVEKWLKQLRSMTTCGLAASGQGQYARKDF
jgi:aspartate aminotransferase-like enzyme